MWAGGPGTVSTTNDDLADLLEAVGGPAVGWRLHSDVVLPSGARAEALAIPVKESLGWLVAVGGGSHGDSVAPSIAWLGRVALLGVRLVARGSVVPSLRTAKRRRRPIGGPVGRLGAGAPRRPRAGCVGRGHARAGRRARPCRRPSDHGRGARRRGRRHRDRGRGTARAAGATPDDQHHGGHRRGLHHPPGRLLVPRVRPVLRARCHAGSTSGPARSRRPAARSWSSSSSRPIPAAPGSSPCSAPAPPASSCPSRWP